MPRERLAAPAELIAALEANIARVLRGKPDAIRHAVISLFARGHLLIEDVPGVGKTTLARALARSIGGTFHRIQFTSDLLPSDVVGVSILDPKSGEFEFRPGPVFANLVLADEINRTPPRTQSALLEAMNEGQVSVDGRTYPLDAPFLVMATQNAEEHYGTYPLPESQMDRFLLRIRIDYPSPEDERRILLESSGRPEDALARLDPVLSVAEVRALQEAAERVHLSRRARRLHRRGRARDPPLAAPLAGRVAARPARLAQRRPRRRARRRARLRSARRSQVARGTGARAPDRPGLSGRGPVTRAQRRRAGAGGHHRPAPRSGMTAPGGPPKRKKHQPPTREGWWFLGATLLVGAAAIDAGINLFFLTFGMMVCLLVAGIALSELGLAGLRVRRVLPPAVHAGTPYLMGIALENRKRRLPSFSIEVEDLIDGRPIEKRCYFLKLPAGRLQETAYRNTMARRGRYRLSGFRLATKFPFGLVPARAGGRRRRRALRLSRPHPRARSAAARPARVPGARTIGSAQPTGRVPRAARVPARRRPARHPLALERAPRDTAGARKRGRGDARGDGDPRQRG